MYDLALRSLITKAKLVAAKDGRLPDNLLGSDALSLLRFGAFVLLERLICDAKNVLALVVLEETELLTCPHHIILRDGCSIGNLLDADILMAVVEQLDDNFHPVRFVTEKT